MVFYYNNKITRAFNTPPILHTFPLLPPRLLKVASGITILPFYIFFAFWNYRFVASTRNFPRYLFQLKARFLFLVSQRLLCARLARVFYFIFPSRKGTLKVPKVSVFMALNSAFFTLAATFAPLPLLQSLLIYNFMATTLRNICALFSLKHLAWMAAAGECVCGCIRVRSSAICVHHNKHAKNTVITFFPGIFFFVIASIANWGCI